MQIVLKEKSPILIQYTHSLSVILYTAYPVQDQGGGLKSIPGDS